MEGYDPRMTFDAANAAVYDELAQRGDEAATVALLAELAQGEPALELAIGTAGLRLRNRWGGWHRQAFTANSDNVISVYGR